MAPIPQRRSPLPGDRRGRSRGPRARRQPPRHLGQRHPRLPLRYRGDESSTGAGGLEARRTRLAPRPSGETAPSRWSRCRGAPATSLETPCADGFSGHRGPNPAPVQTVSRIAARGSHLDHRELRCPRRMLVRPARWPFPPDGRGARRPRRRASRPLCRKDSGPRTARHLDHREGVSLWSSQTTDAVPAGPGAGNQVVGQRGSGCRVVESHGASVIGRHGSSFRVDAGGWDQPGVPVESHDDVPSVVVDVVVAAGAE